MSHHTPIELLSDDDDDDGNGTTTTTTAAAACNNNNSYRTPISNPNNKKRPRLNFQLPTSGDLFIIDDDPTPPKLQKSSLYSPPLVIPETPLSELPKPRKPRLLPVTTSPSSLPGELELIDVESQDTDVMDPVKRTCSEKLGTRSSFDGEKGFKPIVFAEEKKASCSDFDTEQYLDIDSTCYLHETVPSSVQNKNCQEKKGISASVDVECLDESPIINRSTSYFANFRKVKRHLQPTKKHSSSYFEDDTNQVQRLSDREFDKAKTGLEGDSEANGKEKQNKEQLAAVKKKTKEEKMRLMEEKKLKREQEKVRKAALKAEAAKLKELEKEKQKLEKFKFTEKNILPKIDTKVIQLGKIGGHLLTIFGGKDLKYEITSNPIEKSIVWRMTVPEELSQVSSLTTEIRYILLVYEAEEFCKIVNDGSLFKHISSVQARYPDYKICYLINRLASYMYKKDNDKFNSRKDAGDWNRPPVEEVFAKLTTQFANVHSRQCADEAELAEHVVGLTINLAKCHSRKKLTHLSVNANGSNVSKDCVDRSLIMKHPWLKALVSIPKVQPRFAVAIYKKYPNMKSLLRVYLDRNISVHEKEFLLKDLPVEGVLGNEDRRLGEVCSKRVYRILMAQNGSVKTDDAENGADFFHATTISAHS